MKAKKELYMIRGKKIHLKNGGLKRGSGRVRLVKECSGMAECLDLAYRTIRLMGCDISGNIFAGGKRCSYSSISSDASDLYKNGSIRES